MSTQGAGTRTEDELSFIGHWVNQAPCWNRYKYQSPPPLKIRTLEQASLPPCTMKTSVSQKPAMRVGQKTISDWAVPTSQGLTEDSTALSVLRMGSYRGQVGEAGALLVYSESTWARQPGETPPWQEWSQIEWRWEPTVAPCGREEHLSNKNIECLFTFEF